MGNKWRMRKKIVKSTLLFCASVVLYILFKDNSTKLHLAIVNDLILLAGSVIGSYIFGVTWDDKNDKSSDHEN